MTILLRIEQKDCRCAREVGSLRAKFDGFDRCKRFRALRVPETVAQSPAWY